jgi:hypothetical protein
MKKNYPFICVPVLVLLGLIAVLNYGCGKKPTPGAELSPGGGPGAPAVVSAEKTSFIEVTSQLDPGGNFYLYLGTAQWLDGLSDRVGAWRQTVVAMPNLKPEDTTNVNRVFDVVTSLIKDSGIEDVSGVGMSSVEIEKGMFRNKAVLHHYPGKGDGFLWQLAGKQPHPLTGLDYLSADTALAVFSDADLPLLWTVAQKEVAQANLPQAQAWMDKFPDQFEQKTKVKWDTFLNSLGGEFGFVITLDASNNVPVPLPGGALEIPAPGLLLAVKVNDDTIFNRIDEQLKSNQQVISVDQPGLKMRTLPVPLPLPIALRPSAASSGGYLFIASSDTLIDDALAVKSGQQPGLKGTDEFKHVAQGVPDQGNQFCYMSQRFADEDPTTGHGRQHQVRPADGAVAAILSRQPPCLCLFRRRQHTGRLRDHRQRQPELRQRRAVAQCGRGGRAFRHRHPQFRKGPGHRTAERLHQQPPPD